MVEPVSYAARVGGDDRLRLFLALRLPEASLDLLGSWQAAELGGERRRLVPRANLHVTLAFLGHRPAGDLDGVVAALRDGAAAVVGEIRLTPLRYRETRSVGMLVLDDEQGRAGALAAGLHARLEALGVYRREGRPWLPHLTVARFRAKEGMRPGLENIRTHVLIPSDASAYLSRLRPGGAQYEILETVALGGL